MSFKTPQFLDYTEKHHASLKDNTFWKDVSKRIDWYKKPETIQSGGFDNVDFKWFEDGILNVSYNCIDRHLEKDSDKTAIIWAKDEPGEYEHISYGQLSKEVNRVANGLKKLGIKKGDRVCIYLPMIPELAYTMLACTRIGAIHSIVFAGFSAQALRGRIVDSESKVVLTSNVGLRGSKQIPLKAITNEAVEGLDCVEHVVCFERNDTPYEKIDLDLSWSDFIGNVSDECEPEQLNAEDPLFMLYTSGSTGTPKGLVHTNGGYITYAAYTHETVFNYKEGDVYFCAADIGWVTGHSYIIYGPLANGATTVMFESVPTYPDASRYWSIIEDLKVNIFYTSPTALRALAQFGDEAVTKHDRSSLKVLGSVGEPINPEIWNWYNEVVGDKRCPIVDTWWQTETGGILISPIPHVTPLKAGSATRPLYGIEPILVDANSGEEIVGNSVEGALCINRSWPGLARTIYGDHKRFKNTYFSQYPGKYFTGDGCKRDEDGHYWISGRIDDVINVSGHRFGTAEIESCIMTSPSVAEVAVVGADHEIKGTAIYAYVIKQDDKQPDDVVIASIIKQIAEGIGKIAKPDTIQFATGLPKTRSGKVMRRILRKIANNEFDKLGDISTLGDPSVVAQLIEVRKDLK